MAAPIRIAKWDILGQRDKPIAASVTLGKGYPVDTEAGIEFGAAP